MKYLYKKANKTTQKELKLILQRFSSSHKKERPTKNFSTIPKNSNYVSTRQGSATNRNYKNSQKSVINFLNGNLINNHKSFVNEQETKKIQNSAMRLAWEHEINEKCKKKLEEIRRRKNLIKHLREERQAELKRIWKQSEEYKKANVLQKINKTHERSFSFLQNKEAMRKIRQEIHKQARLEKYKICEEIQRNPRKILNKKMFNKTFESGLKKQLKTWKIDEDSEVRIINEKAKRTEKLINKEKQIFNKLEMYMELPRKSYITIN